MKKVLVLVLTAVLIFSLFTGCGNTASKTGADSGQAAASDSTAAGNTDGGNTENGNAETSAAESGNGNAASGSGGIYKDAGNELTDYFTAFTDAEKPFNDALESSLTNADMDTLGAQMTIAMPGLTLSILGMYDVLTLGGETKGEGTLALSGYKGVKEKKGDEIKFSANQEFTEDVNMNKKGDKLSEQGTLNTRTNTLTYEHRMERGGKVVSRIVAECVILDGGTYLLQYFSSSSGEKVSNTAAFKRYGKNEYIALAADFEGGTDFSYDSIVGKGDIQPDDMAKKCTIVGRFTVKDGKAEYAKK